MDTLSETKTDHIEEDYNSGTRKKNNTSNMTIMRTRSCVLFEVDDKVTGGWIGCKGRGFDLKVTLIKWLVKG